MAAPKRALETPERGGRGLAVVVGASLGGALVLALVCGVLWWQVSQPDRQASVASPERTPQQTADVPSPSPSGPPSPSTDPAAALAQCRETVRAADQVIDTAADGIALWAAHVQAQTDAEEGRIAVEGMNEVFAEGHREGPGTVRRYQQAVQHLSGLDASCAPVRGATPDEAVAMVACQDRGERQQPVLAAAEAAMADWSAHLQNTSERNEAGHDEGRWVQEWRAAPPNLEAWRTARERFYAVEC